MAKSGDYTHRRPGWNLLAISQNVDVLDITTDSIITGGGGMENHTEETRNRAQYYVPYDEQVVWGGDYHQFIQQVVNGTSWLNVMGWSMPEEK